MDNGLEIFDPNSEKRSPLHLFDGEQDYDFAHEAVEAATREEFDDAIAAFYQYLKNGYPFDPEAISILIFLYARTGSFFKSREYIDYAQNNKIKLIDDYIIEIQDPQFNHEWKPKLLESFSNNEFLTWENHYNPRKCGYYLFEAGDYEGAKREFEFYLKEIVPGNEEVINYLRTTESLLF